MQSVRVATDGGMVGRGRIRDISASGAFVEASLSLKLFTRVRIQFNSALDGRPTVIEGEVVRKDFNGYGIEWRELAPEAVAREYSPASLPTSGGQRHGRLKPGASPPGLVHWLVRGTPQPWP